MKRYEKLAESLAEMIRAGVLLPGEKAPSVRQASAQYGVSPATVFKAYYLLESRGMIRARERSGYYVSQSAASGMPAPEASAPPADATEVTVNDMIFSVLDSTQRTDMIALGAAFPSTHLFPLRKLAQSLSRANRHADPASGGTNLSPGNEALRRAIARRYLGGGLSVAAEDIVVTNGGLEALTLSLQAVTTPGDVVAIESPGFYAALQIIQMLNLRAVEIPMDPERGMDLQALEQALRRESVSACWCMTNLQNPVGATMPDANKAALVELLGRYRVPLIEDDVYGELYFGAAALQAAKSFDAQGMVLHCGSFSKALAPGYRIGWAIPGRFFEAVRRAKLMTTLSACVPTQLALADYLDTAAYDRHLRSLRHQLEDLQALALNAIAEQFPSGTRVSRPRGGYFLWVEFPGSLDAMKLYSLALQHNVSIAPGPMFSAAGDYGHCIRLNYAQPSSELLEGIRVLGQLSHTLLSKTA